MRSIFRSVLAALVVVLALSAVASAPALAATPEWNENNVPVKESKPVTSEGTLELEGPFGYMSKERFSCSFSSKGTVAPAGKGSVTEEKLTKCKREPRLGQEITQCQEGQPLTATAIGLPWTTQLSSQGEIQTTATKLGWKWECNTVFVENEHKVAWEERFTNECTGGFLNAGSSDQISGVGESFEGRGMGPLPCSAKITGLFHEKGEKKEGDAWPYSSSLIKAAGVKLSIK